jgi:hypothetical protein
MTEQNERKIYLVYDKTTGKINSKVETSNEFTSNEIDHLENVDFIEGNVDINLFKIDVDTKKIIDIVITDEDLKRNEEIKWEDLRLDRNALLQDSDWLMSISDSPLSASKTEEWKTYRQALRDLPANTSDIDNISWPTKPT